jgi:hypothetical protein
MLRTLWRMTITSTISREAGAYIFEVDSSIKRSSLLHQATASASRSLQHPSFSLFAPQSLQIVNRFLILSSQILQSSRCSSRTSLSLSLRLHLLLLFPDTPQSLPRRPLATKLSLLPRLLQSGCLLPSLPLQPTCLPRSLLPPMPLLRLPNPPRSTCLLPSPPRSTCLLPSPPRSTCLLPSPPRSTCLLPSPLPPMPLLLLSPPQLLPKRPPSALLVRILTPPMEQS